MTPSFVVIGLGLDPTRTLVLSQVVLSFALPFAIIPLTIFTSKREISILVNHKITTIVAWLVAAVIVLLNVFLLYQTFFPGS